MIYCNFDLETTGPSPDKNAILSIGAVVDAYRRDSTSEPSRWVRLGEFQRNLMVPPNRGWDMDTLKWWVGNGEAFVAATTDPKRAATVIRHFCAWLLEMSNAEKKAGSDGRIVFVANPIAYDLPYLNSYGREFSKDLWEKVTETSRSLGIHGIDLPNLMACALKLPFPDARRSNWPEAWKPEHLPHDHQAINDARHQAFVFMCAMNALGWVKPDILP